MQRSYPANAMTDQPNARQMRIAVLGATGVAGRAFVAAARGRGHTLVTDRVDIFDATALAAMIEGCDAAVNLVTSIPRPGGRGDWAANDRIRREGTASVVEACHRVEARILIQQSIAMLHCVADDRPQTEDDAIDGYGMLASAVDLEAVVRSATLDGRIVRGALFVGPGTGREEQSTAEVARPDFRVPGDGRSWLSFVHVDDYADALLTVLQRGQPRSAYIAAGEPLRWQDFYDGVAARAGLPAPLPGGPERLRSFRVSNQRLCALGWQPRNAWTIDR
jgi:nucleoside-diphosphate-sugar epimerase